MVLEIVRIALRGLRANKLRSALTTLGNGVRAGFDEQFAGLATQITVTPDDGTAGGYPANRAARLRPIEALRYQ